MKKINILVSCLFIVGIMSAQKNFEKNALTQAKQMAKYFNTKDFTKYVDFLVPSDYGNNPANKEKLAAMWKQSCERDTSSIQIVKSVKSVIAKNQYQILILNRYRNQDWYIFGISNDKGENWVFTQKISTKLNFDAIQETMPTLDSSFSTLVDPKYGKRTNYKVGENLASFKFTDIHGNIVSSDSMKGKVVVLNFWSIYCGPCIKEIPELNELVAKMKGKDVVFIAPAFYGTKDELIQNFLPEHPFNYQIVYIDNSDDYNVNSFPTHIIIDKSSKIINKLIGTSPDNLKKLEEIIDGLSKN